MKEAFPDCSEEDLNLHAVASTRPCRWRARLCILEETRIGTNEKSSPTMTWQATAPSLCSP